MMTDRLKEDLLVLEQDLMVPLTMQDIPSRIFTQWHLESDQEFAVHDMVVQMPWLVWFKHFWKEFWLSDIDGHEKPDRFQRGSSLFIRLFVSALAAMGLAVVPDIFVAFAFWARISPSFAVWFGATSLIFLVLQIGLPIRMRHEHRRELAEAHEAAAALLQSRKNQFWSNPVTMLAIVGSHLVGVYESYEYRRDELLSSFRQVLKLPRREIKRELLQLAADELAFSKLTDDEMPGRQEFLAAIPLRRTACQEMLRGMHPLTVDLVTYFRSINARLLRLENSIIGLAVLKTQYEAAGELLARGQRYRDLSAQEYGSLVQGQRDRELQHIKELLGQLDDEVSGTQQGLAKVVNMLPAPDTYRLPSGSRLALQD